MDSSSREKTFLGTENVILSLQEERGEPKGRENIYNRCFIEKKVGKQEETFH